MRDDLSCRLAEYRDARKLTSKGKLAAILYVSRVARTHGLPLDASALVTDNKGQVLGLGKSTVQAILNEYGIVRVLAEEAGRTSRGSLGNMQHYVAFLNQLHAEGVADIDFIEKWWVGRITDFFSAQPFSLKYDTGKALRAIVRDLLGQARKRQKDNPGTMYCGAVLQHLVGAKLALILPADAVAHHGFSVADAVSARSGDFVIDDVSIHVTTAPGEALMRKCEANLQAGLRPIIITVHDSVLAAEQLAENQGIGGRVDILEAEQFIAANVYELSQFRASGRRVTVERLLEQYNVIVGANETDPSLRIVIG